MMFIYVHNLIFTCFLHNKMIINIRLVNSVVLSNKKQNNCVHKNPIKNRIN